MKGFLLIAASLFLIGACTETPDPRVGPDSGALSATTSNAPKVSECKTATSECWPFPNAGLLGFSGSARIDKNSHLVVHDVDVRNPNADRLGIVRRSGVGNYSYNGVTVDPKAWWNNDPSKLATDLEAACLLSAKEKEYLVIESGRFDTKDKNVHQGRIFHIKLNLSGINPSANVINAMLLGPDRVTDPIKEFSHSIEEYEGLACKELRHAKNEKPKYLVVIGERGDSMVTGTLHWGVYDPAQTVKGQEIKWVFPSDLTGIISLGKGGHLDAQWRDITGLHIDNKGRIYATAAFDHGGVHRPFEGELYQLGVACIDKNTDQHGEIALCGNYSDAPRPQRLTKFKTEKASAAHKFESVSAASGDPALPDTLSIASEDEADGGVWWPAVSH